MSKQQTTLRDLTDHKVGAIGRKILHTEVGRRLLKMVYASVPYQHIKRLVSDFKTYNLLQEIRKYDVPQHLAIIMDGNRRYATTLGLDPKHGHFYGTNKLEQVLEWCFEVKIRFLTVYAFSTENFNRTDDEIHALFSIFREQIRRAKEDSRIHQHEVRVRVLGQTKLLPKDLQEAITEIEEGTESYEKYSFNIALAYGGREEILQAIKEIAQAVKDDQLTVDAINEELVSKHLYTTGLPDPDLILRTSGEARISNFLLWQLAYSELYFSDVFWPAFNKEDFFIAIRQYQQRKRRYGK